ncbi:MAG: hypothetical protein QXM08_04050 [Thermofilaceae archaeon]
MKVTECMKKALSLPEDCTHIYPSELMWNGVIVRDWNGPTVFREFRVGLWLEVLQHLSECWKCRLETGTLLAEVYAEIRKVYKELKDYL